MSERSTDDPDMDGLSRSDPSRGGAARGAARGAAMSAAALKAAPGGTRLARRRFLRLLGLSASASLLAACAPISPPSPTAAPAASKPASAGNAPASKPAAGSTPASSTPASAGSAPATTAPAPTIAAGSGPRSAATPAPAQQQARGGTLRISTGGPLESLFPFRFVEPTLVGQLYDPLIRYDDNLKPQPRLAERWEFSPDKTQITFTLRPNVKFHSGKALTSEDVAYTYKFLTDPKNSSNISDYIKLVKDVSTPDPHTVVFSFKAPTPAALDMFDLFWVIESNPPDLTTTPAGTGPFVLKDWKPGQSARVERNPAYWEVGRPLLDAIECRVVGDVETRMLNLRGKASDFIAQVPIKDVPDLRKDGFEAVPAGGGYFDVLLNVTYPPLVKPEVRQAISRAINRQRFTETILQGNVPPSCLPYPKASFAYDAMLDQSCKYDVGEAKRLLAQAGMADGFDVTLLSSSGMSQESVKLAELIQNDLQAVGIRVKIDNVELAAHQALQKKGDFQMAIHTFGFSNRDPGSLFLTASVWKAEGNSSHYQNAEYADLITRAATTVDDAQRKALYEQVSHHILDDPFVLVIAPSARPNAWTKQVHDMSWNADGYLQLDQTWLAQ
ncbi:MAG: ABC transporter substrate-binding protein [Chloroflexi bacterium]|nr:ABC transporter substrate-binding protein [Chloroflexota bacterium]